MAALKELFTYHRLEDAISNLKNSTSVCVFDFSIKRYASIENFGDFIKGVFGGAESGETMHYHHVMVKDRPTKLFIDIDNDPDQTLTINTVAMIAVNIAAMLKDKEIKCEYLITQSKGKNSFHIHFSGFYFKSPAYMKLWVDNFIKPALPEEHKKYIDWKVYADNHCFRCINSYRGDTSEHKKVAYSWSMQEDDGPFKWSKESIACCFPTIISEYDTKQIIDEVKEKAPAAYKCMVELDERDQRLFTAAEIVMKDIDPNLEISPRPRTDENFLRMHRRIPSKCIIHDRIHERQDNYLNMMYDGRVYLRCFAAGNQSPIKVLDAIKPAVDISNITMDSLPERDAAVKYFFDLSKKYSGKLIHDQTLLQFIADAKGILCLINCGSGLKIYKHSDKFEFCLRDNSPVRFYIKRGTGDQQKQIECGIPDLLKMPAVANLLGYANTCTRIRNDNPDLLNLFDGLIADKHQPPPNTTEIVAAVNNHIMTYWCNNDTNLFNFVISWFAKPIIKGEKNGTALIVCGPQGCGKGSILDFIKKYIYGDGTVTLGVPDEVTSDFNGHLCGKFLIHVDEGSSNSGRSEKGQKLKSFITSDTIVINKKGIDQFPMENVMNLVITSNRCDPVFMETDDRRYTVFDATLPTAENYFDVFRNLIMNHAAGAAYLAWLREFAGAGGCKLRPTNRAYETELKKEVIKDQDKQPWLLEFMDSKSLPEFVTGEEIFKAYTKFLVQSEYTESKYRITRTTLIKVLNQRRYIIKRVFRDKANKYQLNPRYVNMEVADPIDNTDNIDALLAHV